MSRVHRRAQRARVAADTLSRALRVFACVACVACSDLEPPATSQLAANRAALTGDKLSPNHRLAPDAKAARLIVKFKEGSAVRMRAGRIVSSIGTAAVEADLRAVEAALSARKVTLARLFVELRDDQLAELKARGEARSGEVLPELALYHQVPASAFASAAQIEQLRSELIALDSVELAYVEPEPAPPPDAQTPDLRAAQGYKAAAPMGSAPTSRRPFPEAAARACASSTSRARCLPDTRICPRCSTGAETSSPTAARTRPRWPASSQDETTLSA